jgi:hypothetical protein
MLAAYTTVTTYEAGTTGLEPATSRLTSECSAQLSYAPEEWRGWDSNPRSRAHEAREDGRSSTAQVWLAGVEPAISGFQGRRGDQLPYSQMTNENLRRDSGGRDRTCLSRVTVARLAHSTTPERMTEAAGLEPASGAVAACALATRCLTCSAMPP